MFGFPQSYFIFILLPTLFVSVLSYMDFILVKKKHSLYGVSLWNLCTLIYYSVLVLSIVYLNLPTMRYYTYGMLGPNCTIILYVLSVAQLSVYSIFFNKIRLTYTVLVTSFVIFLPVFTNLNFTIFFICIESVTIALGMVFIAKNRKDSFNNALLNLIVSNSITFLLFSISLSSLYIYYGTTNLYLVGILFNYSGLDYIIITLLLVSIICKLGQFPIFFYNIGLYNGLEIPYLGLYTIIYINIIYLPCIFTLKVILSFLFTSVPFLLFIVTILLVMLVSYFSTNTKDFLVISTALYTPLFFLLQ